jgi:hypothetical protein
MNRTSHTAHWALTAALTIGLAAVANQSRAIAPASQMLNPTFDSVVRVLYNNPGHQDAGDGYFEGTGTIIGNHDVNGTGVLCILTADHVLSATGEFGGALVSKPGIAFGNSNKASGDSPYMVARDVMRNGPTGTSDYAVMGVKYGPYNSDYDMLVTNLITTSAFFNFTDIGYGNEGILVDQYAPAGYDGYQSQGVYGTQRFMNDKIDTIATMASNFTKIGYTYTEAAIWHIDDPSAPGAIAGSGTTYGADSGSPYFSSDADVDESTGLSYFTNNQFGIHTGFDPSTNTMGAPDGYKAFGVQNYGVALTQADIDWIHHACDLVAVPEPSALALMFVALLTFAQPRRSSRR